MATSKVEIWNMALGLLHTRNSISSETESSFEKEQCALYHDTALGAVLASIDWGFARKQATLALTGNTPTGWTYEYTYPSDCVQAHRIYNPIDPHSDTLDPLPYEVVTNSAGSGLVIRTDVAEAELVYTQMVSTISVYPDQFVIAFATRLAVFLATSLLGDHAKSREMMQAYLFEIGAAQANDANQGIFTGRADASWIQDRA